MKKFIINIGVVLCDRISILLFQIWLTTYLVKELGLVAFGEWSVVLNLIAIISAIFILGIDVIIVRDIVRDKKNATKYLGTGLVIQLIGFVCVLFIVIFNIDFNNTISYYSSVSILTANIFIILSKPFTWHYSALVESKYRSLSVLISLIICVFLLFSYLNSLNKKEYILFIYGMYYFIQFVVSACVYKFAFKNGLKFEIDKIEIKKYLKVGMSLIISTLSVMLFTQTDILMINHFVGASATGEFSAAVKLSTSVFILAGIIANTFYPKIVELDEKNKLVFLNTLIAIVFVLSICGSLFVSLISANIVDLFFGQNKQITLILSIHIWCSIFIFSGAFTSRYLYANEFYKIEILKTLFAAVTNIFLNLLLIPQYGNIGAVYSSLFAFFIANYLALFFFKETKNIFFIQQSAFISPLRPIYFFRKIKGIKCFFR